MSLTLIEVYSGVFLTNFCHNSLPMGIWQNGKVRVIEMKSREKKKNLAYFPFTAKRLTITEYGYKLMDTIIPRLPFHISESIISFLNFKGDYTRGELQMWAELNSYPYLKRQIAKKISMVLYIEKLDKIPREGCGLNSVDVTIERYLKDETVQLLSRCTNSFFFLVYSSIDKGNFVTPNMDERERAKVSNELFFGGGFHIVDVFNYFGQTPRENPRHLELLYNFEFTRLMKERKRNPETMYLIMRSVRKKKAIMSLFCTPKLLSKGVLLFSDIQQSDSAYELWLDYGVQSFTNPQSHELQDFADNIYHIHQVRLSL